MPQVDAGRLFGNIKNVLDACEEFWYKRLRQVYLNVCIRQTKKFSSLDKIITGPQALVSFVSVALSCFSSQEKVEIY